MTAILFDLDRTLVDVQSFTDYSAALADVEALIGTWDDVPTPATDWDRPTLRAMGILVALSGDPRWDEVSSLIARHELAAMPVSTPMPGAAEALALVPDESAAVVTLLPTDVARRILDHHGLRVQRLVGRSSDLAPKPAADQLVHACQSLSVPVEGATMVGDSTWDAAAAKAAGCRFVGVTNDGTGSFAADIVTAPRVDAAVRLALA